MKNNDYDDDDDDDGLDSREEIQKKNQQALLIVVYCVTYSSTIVFHCVYRHLSVLSPFCPISFARFLSVGLFSHSKSAPSKYPTTINMHGYVGIGVTLKSGIRVMNLFFNYIFAKFSTETENKRETVDTMNRTHILKMHVCNAYTRTHTPNSIIFTNSITI